MCFFNWTNNKPYTATDKPAEKRMRPVKRVAMLDSAFVAVPGNGAKLVAAFRVNQRLGRYAHIAPRA